MDDISILNWAHQYENRPHLNKALTHWERPPGASADDMRRLLNGGYVEITSQSSNRKWYRLTQAGNDLIWNANMEREMTKIPADSIIEAMDLIVGFDDVKESIAYTIESRKRINYLLEGPPACSKSLMLDAIRSTVPKAYIVFGSRTSPAGLSDALFEHQPEILLMDEADKMHHDCYSILLGLMESGEIVETKAQKTRGIKLNTTVIAACNSSTKMPREFKSRFPVHVKFPEYTRDEFIDVCTGLLTRAENAPPEVAKLIGELIYDSGLGDVRKARGAWLQMRAPTLDDARRVINFMLKYAPEIELNHKGRTVSRSRLPGM